MDILCLTNQVTKALSWLGDRSPIKCMATNDHLPVIQNDNKIIKRTDRLLFDLLGSL